MLSRHFQVKVVSFLSKVPFLQHTFTAIYRLIFRSKVEELRAKSFMSKAENILRDFSQCMDETNHFYTLAFGSMLGAIREHGFIKHDADIDVYMWCEDYNQKLIQDLKTYGFSFAHGYTVDSGLNGREVTLVKDGIGIDIFFIYPAVDLLPYCCDFIPQDDCQNPLIAMKKYGGVITRRLEMPFVKERRLVDFESLQLYVPKNAETLLEYRYGKDYMIPNAKWNIHGHDNHIVKWEGKLGIREDQK